MIQTFMYMYIHIKTMAKTIMISNEVYGELKEKKANRSFSQLLKELLDTRKKKTGKDLQRCLGLLKKDKESDSITKSLEIGWKEWNKRYA